MMDVISKIAIYSLKINLYENTITRKHTPECLNAHTCTHTYIHTYTHVFTHAYAHAHAHAHAHARTHTHNMFAL